VSLILSGALLVWSSVAAYPVFIAEGLTFSDKLRLSFARNQLMLAWMGIVFWAVGLPAGIATAGALGASEIGGIVIAKTWMLDVAPRVRHWFMGALSMIAATALAALWWTGGSPRQIGFSTALVTTTVLLQRPALSALRFRLVQAWMIGIFPVYLFATLFASAGKGVVLNPRFASQLAGSYLLIGTAIAIISYLIQEAISARGPASADRSEDPFTRFFDQESPILPVILGLALLGGGGYGLLELSNYTGMDWILYGAMAGTGVFVLMRTFASPE
jgi:hypothetical protein